MKRISCTWAAAALLLAACGSSEHDTPTIDVTELPAGTYAVSTGDAATPTAGKYYAAADGSRLLVLNDSAQQAAALYWREGNGGWQSAAAATQDVKVELLSSSAAPSNVPDAMSVAGSYAVRLASGGVAAFSVNASGDIVAGSTTCKLSGKLATATLPNTLKLTLAATGCGNLPARADGYLVVDGDYSPAGFRLVASGGSTLVDLWAYPE